MRFLLLLLASVALSAQAQPTDMNKAEDGKFSPYMGKPFVLFVDSKDTLFCPKVELWMKGQEVQEVAYTFERKHVTLKGKETLQLQAFYAEDKVLMELIPVDPEKPDKKKQLLFKNLKGYFTVWTNNHSALFGLQAFNWGGQYHAFPTSAEYMSIEGGPIFKVSKKKLMDVIDPKLEECKGIQGTEIHGFLDINYMELTDKCYDYNRLCAPDYK